MSLKTIHTTATHTGSQMRVVRNWTTSRWMNTNRSLSIKLKSMPCLAAHSCPERRIFPYAVKISIRNSSGTVVGSVTFQSNQVGQTKNITIPKNGAYRFTTEFFHTGNPYHLGRIINGVRQPSYFYNGTPANSSWGSCQVWGHHDTVIFENYIEFSATYDTVNVYPS